MQAVPGAVVEPLAAVSGWPNILPGPFILLLLLPAFPLILFSIGARPPDTSALPFTTDDLWQTTAFITVAGAVVLSMGLYPGMLSDVTTWVKDGSGGVWREYLVGNGQGPRTTGDQQWQGGQAYQRPSLSLHQAQPQIQPVEQIVVRYENVPGTKSRIEHRPAEYRQDRQGNVVYRPAARKIIPGTKASKRAVYETVRVQPQQPINDPKSHSTLAGQHLARLRESFLKPYYSTAKPSLLLIMLILLVTVLLLIVVTGKILRATYESDTTARKASSKGSEVDPWHVRELAKRKKESEKETIARNKAQEAAFVGKLKKMDKATRAKEVGQKKKDMEKLKAELSKRKMPLVGMDWDWEGKGAKGGKGEAKKTSDGGKLKKLLLGPLADGPPAKREPAKALPAEGGPGWKPADAAVAHAAIRGGAARAENLANSLVAKK